MSISSSRLLSMMRKIRKMKIMREMKRGRKEMRTKVLGRFLRAERKSLILVGSGSKCVWTMILREN